MIKHVLQTWFVSCPLLILERIQLIFLKYLSEVYYKFTNILLQGLGLLSKIA